MAESPPARANRALAMHSPTHETPRGFWTGVVSGMSPPKSDR
jgi:hypothetical protein